MTGSCIQLELVHANLVLWVKIGEPWIKLSLFISVSPVHHDSGHGWNVSQSNHAQAFSRNRSHLKSQASFVN